MSGTTRNVVWRKSDTPSEVPTPSQINEGDIAVNTADKKVYTVADGVLIDLTDTYSQSELDVLLSDKLDVSDRYTDADAVTAVHTNAEWKATEWDTAYEWGDHALEGYLKNVSWNSVSDKPAFSTVATSGSYSDLSDTPTLGSAASKDASEFDPSGSAAQVENDIRDTLSKAPDPILMYFL